MNIISNWVYGPTVLLLTFDLSTPETIGKVKECYKLLKQDFLNRPIIFAGTKKDLIHDNKSDARDAFFEWVKGENIKIINNENYF